ncbi:uncharacterized protein with the myosin-like domain [Stanieria cyanosphaera PCC 7437]|uniref:Uncharacterized protein with the myosin-like domain n=1 Tax=Stanieria cyanosphaera (strain ATCC 29371 / PCC 7437) TaxID=111780 RepID=K9XVB3_STAC7|nr:DUF3084 domain-containing protein [Stanieria cyanosphaera]AFZ36016.1 uncharacterized protein with the myosin-like domain [Stanieria cyanosphaera PCC 7437]
MTSAYILIAAILLLGGLIAALGDRLGTKVGKARLRLFKLRPRQTAMIVTVLTGTIISASTLGILFTLSESLRKGIFQLDDILKELRTVQQELAAVTEEKEQVKNELSNVVTQQDQAQQQLNQTNRNYQQAQAQLKTISQQANQLKTELNNLLQERQKQLQQLKTLKQESQQLQQKLTEKETKLVEQDRILLDRETRLNQLERQQEVLQQQITVQDQKISSLDNAIADKDFNLQLRKEQLNQLETQIQYLEKEVAILEQYYQTYQELREKRIAIFKGQVLASATVRIVDPNAAMSAIDSVLRQANRSAIKATLFQENNQEERVVKITKAQVEQLAKQIQDGQDYVLRILSAGNYVQGEKEVRVFADLAVNKEVFTAEEEIATVSIDNSQTNTTEIQEQIDWLLAASKFRAGRAGILGEIQVGDEQISSLINFVEKIVDSKESIDEIRAVVAETTYTAGPLKLKLLAVSNGKVMFSL